MSHLSPAQLATFAADALESGESMQDVARQLAGYLLASRQSRELPKLMRTIEDELNRRGNTQVEITSAHQVSDATKQQLAKLLGAKNPIFHETIDSSVIGGVKAKASEKQIDLTVQARLKSFNAAVMRSK